MASVEEIIESVKELGKEAQWELLEGLIAELRGEKKSSKKSKDEKEKKERKPRGPVSEDSFIHFSNRVVLPLLKDISEEYSDEEGKKIKGVKGKAFVSARLWETYKAKSVEDRTKLTKEDIGKLVETHKEEILG
jgi:hypothetical protein